MNRRAFLKTAIAVPVIAAIPWYVERPTEVRRFTLTFDLAKGEDETVVSFKQPDGTLSVWRFRAVRREPPAPLSGGRRETSGVSRSCCPHGIDLSETDCGVCSQRT